MPITRRAFVILGAGASLSACASIGVTSVVPAGATSPAQLTQAAILAAVNDARRLNGNHKPMTYSTRLEAAARSQANLMAQKDTLAHNLGVTLRERVTAAGYEGAVGENIAGGQTTLQQAIEGWLNSPGHRATLLSDKFTEFGLAWAHTSSSIKSKYGNYWCFIAGGSFGPWLNGGDPTAAGDKGGDQLTIGGGVSG
jgi:uncharacterized protein YkwD